MVQRRQVRNETVFNEERSVVVQRALSEVTASTAGCGDVNWSTAETHWLQIFHAKMAQQLARHKSDEVSKEKQVLLMIYVCNFGWDVNWFFL